MSDGALTDAARVQFLRHQRKAAAADVVRALKHVEEHCADLRRDIDRRGADSVLQMSGNLCAASARLEAACAVMKAVREACDTAGVTLTEAAR